METPLRDIVGPIAANTWAVIQAARLRGDPRIAGARIAQQAARYFGAHLKPHSVTPLVVNDAAAALMADQVPAAEWPDEARSSGIDRTRRRAGHYPGHLILAAADGDTTLLVDPTLPLFDRPGLGVGLAPLVTALPAGRPGPGKTPAGQAVTLPGGVVIYEWWDDAGLYRRMPGWSGWSSRYRAEVAMVIRMTRDAMKTESG